MQRFLLLHAVLSLSLISPSLATAQVHTHPATSERPNILFIAVDDLRPELGCFGSTVAKTPNIDHLAADGVCFTHAYCQEAICGPSRASIMTGLRPDSSGVVHNDIYFRDTVPDVMTLPQQLHANGYDTSYVGKIYHGRMTDPEKSWSREPVKVANTFGPALGGYRLPENQQLVKDRRIEAQQRWHDADVYSLSCGPAFECADVPDQAYTDGHTTEVATATIRQFASDRSRPFFFGVGFHKPHLPFVAPKKYWDLYDPNEIELADNPFLPRGATSIGVNSSFELRTRSNIPNAGPIDEKLSRELLHAYLACVSYIDAQVGRLLDELDRTGLRENTIIVLWGDHGWHLGEHGMWGKATNYEIGTRAPLIVSVPGAKANGQQCNALTELIDMYPTICELADIPIPPHVEGCSVAPLLANPNLPWKEAVFSQFPCPSLREWAAQPLSEPMRRTFFGPLIQQAENKLGNEFKEQFDRETFEQYVTGYTIRTPRFRMVKWVDTRTPDKKPLAVELYDEPTDPDENANLANAYRSQDIIDALDEMLRAGYQGALPPASSRKSMTWHTVGQSQASELISHLPQQVTSDSAVQLINNPHDVVEPISLDSVRWEDGFWKQRFQRTHDVSLPVLRRLADSWAYHNMLVAAGDKHDQVRGCDWEDAWVYKWIEAACYLYTQTGEQELLDECDRMIDVIARAQQPDGYLATQITLRNEPRFTMYNNHEVYVMGHLLTAASAHYRITGKTNFLAVARRVADFLYHEYTTSDNEYLINCPLNPSVIMGAVELYKVTGEEQYLQLAKIIIDNRGKPRPTVGRSSWGARMGNSDLNQDRVPLVNSREVVGHAVFWSYLYAGAADYELAVPDAGGAYLPALDRLWTDLVRHKIYVTGAVSPIHKGLSNRSFQPGVRTIVSDEVHEAVGLPYELPNATGYNETCGQIGFMMWNARMLQLYGKAKYADQMERTLYNSIISGVNISGRGWSYTNPLRWYGPKHELITNDFHQRMDPAAHQICCPTNLLRTEASWHGQLYGTSDDGLWIHHYGASRAAFMMSKVGPVELTQETSYPWDGRVTLVLNKMPENAEPYSIRLRIPMWADEASVKINGTPVDPEEVAIQCGTYAELQRPWHPGDRIELNMPMRVKLIAGNPRVEHARGQVAVQRGPIVYCVESTDLPKEIRIEQVRLPSDSTWNVRHDPELLGGVTVLETTALAINDIKPGDSGSLYREYRPQPLRSFTLRLVPYYAWNNRGEPEMSVWLPLH